MIVEKIEKYKEFVGVSVFIGMLYYCGYLSISSFSNILGLNINLTPLDLIKGGADFIIASILDFYNYTLAKPKAFIIFFIKEESILIILISILLVFYFRLLKNKESVLKASLFYLLLIVLAGITLKKQSDIIRLKSVLQIPIHRIYFKYEPIDSNLKKQSLEINSIYKLYMEELRVANESQYDLISKFFNLNDLNDTNTSNRVYSYQILFIVSLLLLILSFVVFNKLVYYNHFIKCWLITNGVINILLIPATYGCIGKNYMFPYEKIVVNNALSIETHIGYTIFSNENELILYDQLDFFKIKHLKKASIQSRVQLFYTSPFDIKIPNQPPICDDIYTLRQPVVLKDL